MTCANAVPRRGLPTDLTSRRDASTLCARKLPRLMSSTVVGASRVAEELTRKLERVLAERQRIIECGDALARTGRCCKPTHTPMVLARELAALLGQQTTLLG